ncbi:MAG: type I-C CRISPR-associated protein Cas8c/Csd1, partial [Kiritimatiellia bacterium]
KTRLGDTTALFWTEKRSPVENCLPWLISAETPTEESALDEATRGHLKDYFKIIRKGSPVDVIHEELATRYFVLGIAPNSARITIKFWHTETLGTLLKRLQKHHEALAIERQSENMPIEIPLRKILLTTAREPKDIPPLLPSALLRSITEDQPYPISLYQLLLNRINVSCQDKNGKYKCGSKVSYVQAATIKAILIRNYKKGELTMSLNPDNHTTPYLLGRLFATLEKTQGDALGDVNAGIGDKYYSSASSTPSIVFPTLLNLFRKHLKKLAAEKPGLAHIREVLVQEIMDHLDSTTGFPANLTLEDRGLFAIGYYQQMRDFYRKKDDKQTTEQN